MFNEEISTYHSAKSSLMHSPVLRGCPNIFGGEGRVLPSPSDSGPPLSPSTAMGPLRLIPMRKMLQMAVLVPPRVQDQAAQQAAPQGPLVPPLEQPFAQLSGLYMGISMPPPVGPGPPSQGGSAAQLAVQAAPTAQGTDAELVAGSTGDLRGQASPHFGPH